MNIKATPVLTFQNERGWWHFRLRADGVNGDIVPLPPLPTAAAAKRRAVEMGDTISWALFHRWQSGDLKFAALQAGLAAAQKPLQFINRQ